MSNALPKSDVVKRVEEMAAQREERRRSVEAFKEERAAYAAAAEAFGGIDAVEFLQRIEKYRRLNGLQVRQLLGLLNGHKMSISGHHRMEAQPFESAFEEAHATLSKGTLVRCCLRGNGSLG